MSGEIEYGMCEVCKKETQLQRTYWHYVIKCECHSPSHFEMIRHCADCIPQEPTTTIITFKTETIEKGRLSKEGLRDILLEYSKEYVFLPYPAQSGSHEDLVDEFLKENL